MRSRRSNAPCICATSRAENTLGTTTNPSSKKSWTCLRLSRSKEDASRELLTVVLAFLRHRDSYPGHASVSGVPNSPKIATPRPRQPRPGATIVMSSSGGASTALGKESPCSITSP